MTFLLISVGSTVTTYQAGMAVSDWPTTQGSWFYPVQEWLAAAWDFFLEHGHRMLAQLVGLTAIAMAVVLWKLDRRRWMRWMGAAVVAGVALQAVLGGFRVLWDAVLLAKIHGCTAPLLLGLSAALVVLTSPRWRQPDGPRSHPAARGLGCLTVVMTAAVYVLIVLGAQLRHLLGWFELWVWLKLIAVGLVAIGLVWLLIYVSRRAGDEAMILRRARLLIVLFAVQLLLGVSAWVTHYGWPGWFRNYLWPIEYTIVQEGLLQVWTTTAHAAAGSLNLIVSLALALWSRRLLQAPAREASR